MYTLQPRLWPRRLLVVVVLLLFFGGGEGDEAATGRAEVVIEYKVCQQLSFLSS